MWGSIRKFKIGVASLVLVMSIVLWFAGTEPALFQRRLGMSLKSQANTDKVPPSVSHSYTSISCPLLQAVRDFCEGLSEYCSDPLCFRMALLPTKIADGADIW